MSKDKWIWDTIGAAIESGWIDLRFCMNLNLEQCEELADDYRLHCNNLEMEKENE